jgi:hypothetical protein
MKTVMSRFISSRHFIRNRFNIRTPFLLLVGCDKLGRKYIMMGGMLLAILLTDQFTNKCLKQRMKNKTEIVANTKIVSELKENKKQTMDSIYTTNKEYSDGTTLLEVKP